jgi:hypothetical protein
MQDNAAVTRNEAVNQVEKCLQVGSCCEANHRRFVIGYFQYARVLQPLIGALIA